MPNIFLSCFYFFVCLLSAAQHLIPAVVCDSSFYYVYSCIILYVSKITHTHIFIFLLGLDNVCFLSSHVSSLICLPFPPSFYCSIVFIRVTCAVSWFA